MSKMIMTEADGVTFYVDTQHKHSIDYVSGKPYYEYAFTPYAALDNALCNQHDKTLKIGVSESPALQFKRKELRVKLLQKIHAGHEMNEEYFAMFGVTKGNSTAGNSTAMTVFNINTLFWQMSSDKTSTKDTSTPSRDFASFIEKTFSLKREIAWRFAWALLRAAYLERWVSVTVLLKLCKGRGIDDSDFLRGLENEITRLKNKVLL